MADTLELVFNYEETKKISPEVFSKKEQYRSRLWEDEKPEDIEIFEEPDLEFVEYFKDKKSQKQTVDYFMALVRQKIIEVIGEEFCPSCGVEMYLKLKVGKTSFQYCRFCDYTDSEQFLKIFTHLAAQKFKQEKISFIHLESPYCNL